MRKNRIQGISAWILVVFTAVLCILGFFAVRWLTKPPDTEATQEQAAVITVEVAQAEMNEWPLTLELNGTVEAEDELQIGSEVSGLRVTGVFVEEGDFVNSGDLLATLNSQVLEARLTQLQARYTQQQANLSKARQPQRPLEIAQLESAVSQAKAQVQQEKANLQQAQAALNNAQVNAQRYESLYEKGAVPSLEAENRDLELQSQSAQVQAARDRVQAAQFAVKQAEESLALARSGGREEDVTIAQAQLTELSGQIDELQAQIAQTRITAPTSGWVLSRTAQLGDIASVGNVLFTMARGGALELRGEIPETEVSKVNPGQKAVVNHSGREIEASVDRIAPLVDATTRNAEVLLSLPKNSGLQPGMFAAATIFLGEQQAVTIPLNSIRGEQPDHYVFTVKNEKVSRTNVAVEGRKAGRAAISSGLNAGTAVVVEGGGFLRDGDRVTVQ